MKSLLFDLDGTLINTNELIFKSFIHTFKIFFKDYELSNEELISFCGPTLEYTFSRYESDHDMVLKMIDTYAEWNIKHHDEYVTIFANVKETLDILKTKGYKMGIVSSKRRPVVLMGLRLFDLEKYFEVILTAEDVKKHKPDPEIVNKALSALDSDDSIIIGDNVSDLMAGRNANIKTCGVNWSLKAKDLQAFKPDYFIYDMMELLSIVE